MKKWIAVGVGIFIMVFSGVAYSVCGGPEPSKNMGSFGSFSFYGNGDGHAATAWFQPGNAPANPWDEFWFDNSGNFNLGGGIIAQGAIGVGSPLANTTTEQVIAEQTATDSGGGEVVLWAKTVQATAAAGRFGRRNRERISHGWGHARSLALERSLQCGALGVRVARDRMCGLLGRRVFVLLQRFGLVSRKRPGYGLRMVRSFREKTWYSNPFGFGPGVSDHERIRRDLLSARRRHGNRGEQGQCDRLRLPFDRYEHHTGERSHVLTRRHDCFMRFRRPVQSCYRRGPDSSIQRNIRQPDHLHCKREPALINGGSSVVSGWVSSWPNNVSKSRH